MVVMRWVCSLRWVLPALPSSPHPSAAHCICVHVWTRARKCSETEASRQAGWRRGVVPRDEALQAGIEACTCMLIPSNSPTFMQRAPHQQVSMTWGEKRKHCLIMLRPHQSAKWKACFRGVEGGGVKTASGTSWSPWLCRYLCLTGSSVLQMHPEHLR